MHSSDTYAQLLLSLPPELRDHVVGYAQLKKLIHQTVSELSSLGPSISGSDVTHGQSTASLTACFEPDGSPSQEASLSGRSRESWKSPIDHDIASHAILLDPRPGLSLRYPLDTDIPSDPRPTCHVELHIPEQGLRNAIQAARRPCPSESIEDQLNDAEKPIPLSDLIVLLPTDAGFFQLLTPNITFPFVWFDEITSNFNSILTTLAEVIARTAIPSSSSARRSFSAYSLAAGNASTLRPKTGGKSDLLIWREIFRLYGEAEIFESVGESSRGNRSVEDAETRLKIFVTLAREKKSSLVLAGSREAFEAFLKLNTFILDVKKLELATSEVIQKILQEHAEPTTFRIPTHLLIPKEASSTDISLNLASIPRLAKPLSMFFIQSLGEIILPVVPHIDDYSCLICTAIAFKPIRLGCRHFFCVRCLAKLQKRRRADCPMCRAPTVLQANAANVDYALLNFMADWFPNESREKQRANDREATRELMEEYRNARKRQRRSDGCWIM